MDSSNLLKRQKIFSSELYSVHLEEASFLYEQRLSLLNDPEVTWMDVGEFEDRFEAHIDALVVGEEPALDMCRMQAQEGDFGELHAAMRVFCRQNKRDFVADAWRDLDPEDLERTKAIGDALKDECHDYWQESLTPIFLRDHFDLIPAAAPVFGHRRFKAEEPLLHALKNAPADILPPVIWALGRVGEQAAHAALLPLLEHPEDAVRAATAQSLLRFGQPDVISRSMSHALSENWPMTALGLGGGRNASNVLLERVKRGEADNDCLISLGVLGHLSAVKALYSSLENEDLARSAATGLYLITGAEIFEEV